MFEPEVNEAIQNFSDMLSEKYPEVGEILARARAGEVVEIEAMKMLMEKVQELDIASNIEEVASEALAPIQDHGNPLDIEGPEPPLVTTSERGVQSLNPLVEAAIAERVQFDGDVPELRQGPLPQGATPAVPVDTKTRNPVALGVMLDTASQEVHQEIQEAVQNHVNLLQDLSWDESTALESMKGLPPVPSGVEGYEAGKVPAFRVVKEPSGSEMALMPEEQKQQSAWKAISTTQGRRSALQAIEEMLLVGLIEEGFDIPSRPPHPVKEVSIHATWSMAISGQRDMQSNFNFIEVAARSLLRQITEQARKKGLPSDPFLEVQAVNTVDIRQAGWSARIVPGS